MGLLDPQNIVLATLAASLVLFVTDAIRYDAVAILVVLVLAGTGTLDYADAFSNFAHPAVILVASMYAFAAAVSKTGITDGLCKRLLAGQASSEAWLAFRLVLVTGLLSSVLSNAAVVATMIPVLGMVARRSEIPVSRLLMPMAFGSLLGGMLTLIGTSKNIAVNGVIEKMGKVPFELFDFTPFGFALLVVGALYFWGPGRALLPRSGQQETLSERYSVPKFLTEVLVSPGSGLINRAVGELHMMERYGITLLGVVREGGEKVLAPGPYHRIRSDDVLILQGEPDAILKMRQESELSEKSSVDVGDVHLVADDVQLVEAVVPPTSTLIGRTLAEADFRGNTNLNVLAISKHGEMRPLRIRETSISVGDTLLVQGHGPDLERVTTQRELIVLDEHQPPDVGRAAVLTVLLLAAVLCVGAFTSINISVAALGGAVGLVLLKCVRTEDVKRNVDLSVLILIGGMLSLGMAFREVGLDVRVAQWMESVGGGLAHPTMVIGLLFVTTLLLTQVINHLAAGVLMAPVAISLAEQLGWSDRPLLMAVFTGAEFAFMSPVAHQANAMIMGPGDYKYRDFLKCGTPLTIILVIVATLLIPIFWPITG
jgi:di/tricarboxylate transporter